MPALLIVLLLIVSIVAAGAWYLVFAPHSSPRPPQHTNVAGQQLASIGSIGQAKSSPAASVPASPSPSAAGSNAPSASEAPSASIDPQVVAQIDAVVKTVPDIRQLQPKAEVPYRFITRDEYAVEAKEQFNKDNPPDVVAAEGNLDKHLGLLPPDMDLGQAELDLLVGQVAAFYDPETKKFTVIQDPGHTFSADDKVTVAHEYDHALQDQYFDLTKLQDIPTDQADHLAAVTALAEGDATDVMYEWAFSNLSVEEIAGLGSSGTPEDQQALDNAPMLLRQSLTFPYLSGLSFVTAIQSNGGWDAVNKVWASPPVSTEQIMHPEKYDAGEQPIDVQLPNLEGNLGSGWHQAVSEVEGEFFTGVWVANGDEGDGGALGGLLGGLGGLPNADAAAGWGGDRIASYDGPNGSWVVVWQTAWDTAKDATEFQQAATAVTVPGPMSVTPTSLAGDIPNPMLVIIASDQGTLNSVKSNLPSG